MNYKFSILPKGHYHSETGGCPRCNTDVHLKKLKDDYKKIYGDKNDYNKCIYDYDKFRIKIYCNKHEIFFSLNPTEHLSKDCHKCRKELKKIDKKTKIVKLQDNIKYLENEEFKNINIIGYKNYKVSNFGRVLSGNRLLKGYINHNGYTTVRLKNTLDGKQKNERVHRLVAFTFLNSCSDKNVVDHIDRNPHNNNATNLRWVTQKENMNNRKKQREPSVKNVIIFDDEVFTPLKI